MASSRLLFVAASTRKSAALFTLGGSSSTTSSSGGVLRGLVVSSSPRIISSIVSSRRTLSSKPDDKDNEEAGTSLTVVEKLQETSPAYANALKQNNDDDLYKSNDSYPNYEENKNEIELYVDQMHKQNSNLIWTSSMLPSVDPPLPKKPSEVAATDPSYDTWSEGHTKRVVHIRQKHKRQNQAPVNTEQTWMISFIDDGRTGEIGTKWTNPLMGWKSGADPMSSNTIQITFDNAKEAVYFAKKRGWDYIVDQPRYRKMRSDNATYQDNFLPQNIAYDVMKHGTKCNVWERSKAGTSHYYRPLKYHGNGYVTQHGPNGTAPIDDAPEGYYKMR